MILSCNHLSVFTFKFKKMLPCNHRSVFTIKFCLMSCPKECFHAINLVSLLLNVKKYCHAIILVFLIPNFTLNFKSNNNAQLSSSFLTVRALTKIVAEATKNNFTPRDFFMKRTLIPLNQRLNGITGHKVLEARGHSIPTKDRVLRTLTPLRRECVRYTITDSWTKKQNEN